MKRLPKFQTKYFITQPSENSSPDFIKDEPSLQAAVQSKPPLFTTQSSRFTKTTPRFPFADLCIPADQSPFIHHSQTRGGGWGKPQTSGRYKVGDNAPSNTEKKPKQTTTPVWQSFQVQWTQKAVKSELRKSQVQVLSPDKTRNEVATLEFPAGHFVARGKFTPLESTLKIKFSYRETI